MSTAQTLLLGAVAGFTIFLGLPIGRMQNVGAHTKAFLSAVATGVLVFLLWDVLTTAVDPIESALKTGRDGRFLWLASLTPGKRLALLIATGIGIHNFGEGLAIGQSAAADEVALALVLIIGFALHNATEGFGIVGPMAGEAEPPSWSFLGLLGLIGGAPTFLGTALGYAWVSEGLQVLFFSLAAGSILYVVMELFHVCRRYSMPVLETWMILLGIFLGFATDFVLEAAGG